MELLQFVFSSFWVWLGCVVLIVAAGDVLKLFPWNNS